MGAPLRIDIVTIFPGMLEGFLGQSILKRATDKGCVRFRAVDPRCFTDDTHRSTDDRPYGGGPGMVMKPEPLLRAIESVVDSAARVVLMTPQGRPFEQTIAWELSRGEHLVFVCGHYEGVDERIREKFVDDEISIGDYVLTNGTLAAAVVIDAVVRLIPGVLGAEESLADESFRHGRLEYPQYTRPAEFRGMKVPDVLLSGDHGKIECWRRRRSEERTLRRRPDLVERCRRATEGGMEETSERTE